MSRNIATMNLILLGYRASGKTTLGQAIANALGWPFVDTDEVVRQRFEGRTIAQIWNQEGEPAFRATECQVVKHLLQGTHQVIALGGGTPMQPDARASIEKADAVRIYLHAPAEVLSQRLESDATSNSQRPHLTSQGGGLGEVKSVLAEREPTYRALSDHIFDTSELTLDRLDQAASDLIGLAGL